MIENGLIEEHAIKTKLNLFFRNVSRICTLVSQLIRSCQTLFLFELREHCMCIIKGASTVLATGLPLPFHFNTSAQQLEHSQQPDKSVQY